MCELDVPGFPRACPEGLPTRRVGKRCIPLALEELKPMGRRVGETVYPFGVEELKPIGVDGLGAPPNRGRKALGAPSQCGFASRTGLDFCLSLAWQVSPCERLLCLFPCVFVCVTIICWHLFVA